MMKYEEEGWYYERNIEASFNFEEMMKFKEDDLYPDCSFVALQIAGALNYLKVKGFDNALLENLKKQQTWPFASDYKFKVFNFPYIKDSEYILTVPNTDLIKNFSTDYQKIEKFLFKHVDSSCNARVTEITYSQTTAYVYVEHDIGYNDFLLKLNPDKTITIEYISFAIH
jgi:hypothetical protein